MRKLLRLSFVLAFLLTATTACGSGYRHISEDSGLIIGTTDHVTTLDPAGSYENGSFALYGQVYPFLLNFPYGGDKPTPDAAEDCKFAQPTRFRCVLRPNLKFANGHPLTSKSVKFSFDRIVTIGKTPDGAQGPSSLLVNLDHVETPDQRTVDFVLKVANDQTFAPLLAVNVGPILDEQVFPADRILDDDSIVAAQPFAGPYTIATYNKNDLVLLQARPDYQGLYGQPKTAQVVFKYYSNAVDLKLDLIKHQVNIVFRELSTTDYAELGRTPGVKVWTGAGGQMRYLAFNRQSQPGQNDAQKLAVRKAVAASLDRKQLAHEVFQDLFAPAWSAVPDNYPGYVPAYQEAYGDRPDKAKAAGFLKAAGVQTPVTLRIQYTTEHYGPSSSEEYALIKNQLEATGLFRVELQSTEWTVYTAEYAKGSYPLFQLGWFPDFPDADNYLTPFFTDKNFINNGFADPQAVKLLDSQRTDPNPEHRAQTLGQVQREVAQNLVSVIPLLVGRQILAARTNVTGIEGAINGAYKLRVGCLETSGDGRPGDHA